jgi:hypothetical protein
VEGGSEGKPAVGNGTNGVGTKLPIFSAIKQEDNNSVNESELNNSQI